MANHPQLDAVRQQALEYQSDQIELVLHTHRVHARVVGGLVTPRWVRFQVLPALGTKVAAITKLSEEIALTLGVDAVRLCRHGPSIHVEVPRPDAQPVHLLSLYQQLSDIPKQSAILGLDESGMPLILRLPSPEVAHVLISGTTGSGKTALAQTMALSLAMYNRLGEVQLIMLDPKGGTTCSSGFGSLVGLPHLLRPVVRELHQAIFLLGELVEEMVRRDREGISEPRVVILIDEVADLMEQGGNAMGRLLARLTQRGRSAGLHLIACTQKPLAASIGSLTKSNFPVRVVGSVASAEDAKVAAGIAGTGAEKLLGRGDFLLISKGKVTRFQGAYISQTEMRQTIKQMQGSMRRSRRWLAEETPIALAPTGTEGGSPEPSSPVKPRRLKNLFGTQLRLIK